MWIAKIALLALGAVFSFGAIAQGREKSPLPKDPPEAYEQIMLAQKKSADPRALPKDPPDEEKKAARKPAGKKTEKKAKGEKKAEKGKK